MDTYTNVTFSRDERDVFKQAALHTGLIRAQEVDGHNKNILDHLARDRSAGTHSKLVAAQAVLAALASIIDLEMKAWHQASLTASEEPEPAPEGSVPLVANPKQAYAMLSEIREGQLHDVDAARQLVDKALALAVPAREDEKYVGV